MDTGRESLTDRSALAGARLTIDLGALTANWRSLAARAPASETSAVVKADAYGTGIEAAGPALAAAGCRTFFVALPDEGIRLRAAVPGAVIYVLNGLIEGSAPALAAHDLRPALASWPEIEEWAAFKQGGSPVKAAIHVDTGMNRLGLSLHEAVGLARRPELLARLDAALLMSHFASPDTPEHPLNLRQLALFREVVRQFPPMPTSLASSAAIFLGSDFHGDIVRPGIALYGGAPLAGVANPMRPVVTAEARVLAVRDAEAGETVGYGGGEVVRRPSRIAILGAGYADGYHRLAGSSDARKGAQVAIRGHRFPLIGRVSMDLIAVDVTDRPGIVRGDTAELFGPNVPIDEVAAAAGTVAYELLTGLGRRYARTYVGA
jgi:alanine racemase